MRSLALLGGSVFAIVAAGCGGPAESRYVAANMRILSQAKPYPGAKLNRVENAPYGAPDSEYGPTIGYTTVAYYTLTGPARVDAIVAFYVHELRGWRENATPIPCIRVGPPPGVSAPPGAPRSCTGPLHVDFHRSKAHIAMDLEDRDLPRGAHEGYGVSIDYDAAR
jgi:hypothetical protein